MKDLAWPAAVALLALLVPRLGCASGLEPLAGIPGSAPEAPWVFAGLPGKAIPATRFALELQGEQSVLRVQTSASYGYLLHPLSNIAAGRLSWRWRVDQPLAAADLRTRAGDDVALKICALFDMPKVVVPFMERQVMRLAESRTGESLPAATLCYAWDPSWPEGTVVANAYSRRVRYITLRAPRGIWSQVSRDLAADFVRVFGDETTTVPPLRAIGVGADSDNTGGSSLGFVADLKLNP